MKRLRLTTVLLVLLNVALAVCVALLWNRGQQRVTEPARLNIPPLELPDLAALNSVPMPSVEVGTIREQAVFYASRAFYTPPVAAVSVPAPEYDISGTLRLPDGKRIAFVKKKADQSGRTLHIGDDLEGWRVSEQSVELRTAAGAGVSGLIRGQGTARTVQTGNRILGGAGTGAPQSTVQGREARLYRPPPAVGK
jgi:hypothetical protein